MSYDDWKTTLIARLGPPRMCCPESSTNQNGLTRIEITMGGPRLLLYALGWQSHLRLVQYSPCLYIHVCVCSVFTYFKFIKRGLFGSLVVTEFNFYFWLFKIPRNFYQNFLNLYYFGWNPIQDESEFTELIIVFLIHFLTIIVNSCSY